MTHRVEEATPADWPALVGLWNACLGRTHPMTDRLLRENLEGAARTTAAISFVVRGRAGVVGWVQARAYRNPAALSPQASDIEREAARILAPLSGQGGLTALCVDPGERGHGIGTSLLAAAEDRLARWGVKAAATTVAPFHFLPGVPESAAELDRFLERHGWSAVADCVDLDADVGDFVPPPEVEERIRREAPQVELRTLQAGEETSLHALLSADLPVVWRLILRDFLAAGGSREDVMVAVEHGQVLAFCHVHDERSVRLAGSTAWYPLLGPAYGGLGPIGVAAAHRRRGLGLALLSAALAHQRRRGVRRMVIDWTTLIDFYGRVGFRVWRCYRQRRRDLSPAN